MKYQLNQNFSKTALIIGAYFRKIKSDITIQSKFLSVELIVRKIKIEA